MSDEATVQLACSSDKPLLDVIFVHGLTGDAKKTWESRSDGSFWPEWLHGDLQHLSIYTVGYPASLFVKWAKIEMDMFERAGNVLERLVAIGVGARPIAFVTHSLGGILTKLLIQKSTNSEDEDCNRVAELTRLVVFLATPHSGAALAEVLNILPGMPAHVSLLGNKTGFLEHLNDQYRTYANGRSDLSTKVYYEKFATKAGVVVVERTSADPGVAKAQPVAVDADHINICKPVDKDDTVYLSVKRHIAKLLEAIRTATPCGTRGPTGDDYSSKLLSDRRDLLQKLIDADREHEYSYANDAQNSFAQRFTKTGLFTAARDDHDFLLSAVETRFITHVYHPLICKGGSDEDIRTAIQSHIVDPLSAKQIGGTRFLPKDILSALYFLTEQCHVKWDPPA